ncbi:hypothetical protein VTP01DRAFT_9600 [Rhizomucor pusillus]|uniref:uncharacterized protein n=1 Tax=Rhizomucor pusillus TaxID=4840 RepID=UPI0037446533
MHVRPNQPVVFAAVTKGKACLPSVSDSQIEIRAGFNASDSTNRGVLDRLHRHLCLLIPDRMRKSIGHVYTHTIICSVVVMFRKLFCHV